MPQLSSELLVLAWTLGGALVLSLAVLGWLNLSHGSKSRKWRNHSPNEPFPHMHTVDGVVITHSHPGGEGEHTHKEITVSMQHYAALARMAQQNQGTP